MTDYTNRHIFRLVHFDNLEEILKNGMYSRNSEHFVKTYVNIGDTTLIKQRESYIVRVTPPNGHLGDYIPFYFAGHSPMLLNIKTGDRGIRQQAQENLVYVVCKISSVMEHCPQWCFTDGHAKSFITKFYNKTEDLSQLDWHTIRQQIWRSTEDDMDRMRRKQAEFLVKEHVPVCCICGLIVLGSKQEEKAQKILELAGITLPIHIDKDRKYFYP